MKRLGFLFLVLVIFSNNLQAQWEQLGPFGASIYNLGNSGNNIFAGTGNGLFRTTDYGLTWNKSKLGHTTSNRIHVFGLAIDGENIFAGTNYGLSYSTDCGQTWTLNDNFNIFFVELAIHDNVLYAGDIDAGIAKSTDFGSTWLRVNNGIPDETNITSFLFKDNYIYAASADSGIFVSTNEGASWNAAINRLMNLEVYSLAKNGDDIYAGTALGGLYKSSNNGLSWDAINIGLPESNVSSIKLSNNKIYVGLSTYSTVGEVYVSSDNGITWTPIYSDSLNYRISSLLLINNDILAGTNNGVIFNSNDSPSWIKLNHGMTNVDVNGLERHNDILFATTSNDGLISSFDDGLTWNQITREIEGNDDLYGLKSVGNYLYLKTFSEIYRSDNNGLKWDKVYDRVYDNPRSLAFKDDKIFVGTQRDGIYVSDNDGLSWVRKNNGFPNWWNLAVHSITVKNNYLFAGLANSIYRSSDDGENWILSNAGMENITPRAFLIIDNKILVTSREGIFQSTNNGDSWQAKNNGLSNLQTGSLAAVDDQILVRTNDGIYLSNDFGENWKKIIGTIDGLPIASMRIINNFIYSKVNYHGLYRRPLSDFGITNLEDKENIPTNFTLEQNYPNPFNPTTTIKFSIPNVADAFHASTNHVTLKIYDLLGNEITTLVNEQKQLGVYEVTFDGSNLSSGVYFYTLQTGGFNQTKKLLLMK